MNVSKFLSIGALIAAFSLPFAASAQQADQQQQPPPPQAQGRGTPSQSVMQARWMDRLGSLNLSSQQQQQIQSIIGQFAQGHPAGSPRDPRAMRALRQQIIGVLSPDQRSQFKQQTRAMRQQHAQQSQQQQQPPGNPPQQSPPR